MKPHLRWLPGLLCCICGLPLAGCCAIAQGMTALFCGAREEAWPTVSYRTPREARLTFQEAVARDDSLVIYKSWSQDFKQRWGLGILEHEVAWRKIRTEIPGIHTLGLAKVVATPRQEDTVVEYVLEVAFHRFRMVLKRYNYYSVVVPGPEPDQPIPKGDYLPDFSRNLRIRHRGEMSDLAVQISDLEIPGLLAEDILEVTLGREWKVDLFEPATEEKE